MRRNVPEMLADIARARVVFPVPGMSSRRMCPPARKEARASSTSLLFPRRTVSTLERSRERSARASWESIRILSPKRFRTFRVFFGMEFEWVSGHHRNRGKDEEKAGPPRAAARGDGRDDPVSRRLSGRLGGDAQGRPGGGTVRGRRAGGGGGGRRCSTSPDGPCPAPFRGPNR